MFGLGDHWHSLNWCTCMLYAGTHIYLKSECIHARTTYYSDGYSIASVYVWWEGEFQLKNKKQSHHCDIAHG